MNAPDDVALTPNGLLKPSVGMLVNCSRVEGSAPLGSSGASNDANVVFSLFPINCLLNKFG